MSAENVEVIRGMVEAWLAGDVETARAALHPEIVWHDPPEQPGEIVYRGREGADASMEGWIGEWDDYRYEPLDYIDLGERVLVVARQSGRGKGSGVEVSSEVGAARGVRRSPVGGSLSK